MDSENTSIIRGTAIGTLIGFVFMVGGYLLLRGDQTQFGLVTFILVPFVSGFAVAAIVRKPGRIAACCFTGLLLCLLFLFFVGLEGYLCCILATPLVAVGMALGALIGYYVRGRIIDRMDSPGKKTLLVLLLCPLFIAAADRVERPIRAVQQHETFTTETILSTSPERAWDLLAKMPRLDDPRPFLVAVGLPVPQSCELDSPTVGSPRVCYFNNGLIEQKVTDWNRPVFMAFKITRSTLPGRHWLTFIDASYELSGVGNQTRVVRATTIGTRLYPRWYWRPFERWGVTSEHEYVLSNLQKWAQPK
jgi:hypothetical protein